MGTGGGICLHVCVVALDTARPTGPVGGTEPGTGPVPGDERWPVLAADAEEARGEGRKSGLWWRHGCGRRVPWHTCGAGSVVSGTPTLLGRCLCTVLGTCPQSPVDAGSRDAAGRGALATGRNLGSPYPAPGAGRAGPSSPPSLSGGSGLGGGQEAPKEVTSAPVPRPSFLPILVLSRCCSWQKERARPPAPFLAPGQARRMPPRRPRHALPC